MTAFKSTSKKISLDAIVVDADVQRVEGIDQRRVDKFAKDFRPHALGTITVSQRPGGSYVVLDGMHRVAAARAAGFLGMIDAKVFFDLDAGQEHELFLYLNNGKMPSALSRFHARVGMGEPDAIAIANILTAHQWQIDPLDDAGHLAAIEAVERIYRNGAGTLPEGAHGDLLERVIEIITIAWEWDSKSVQSHMLLAVAQLLGRYGASVDTKKLTEEMQSTRPLVLIGRAKTLRDAQGGTVSAALAKILAGMHNRKRRTNLLPDWVWIR